MNKETNKGTAQSKTMWAAFATIALGIIAKYSPDVALTLKIHAPEIIIALGTIFAVLRKVTNKALTWLPLGIGLFCFCFCLPSCGISTGEGPDIRGPITGAVYKYDVETGKRKPVIDNTTITSWFDKLTRVISGEKVKDIIIPEKAK